MTTQAGVPADLYVCEQFLHIFAQGSLRNVQAAAKRGQGAAKADYSGFQKVMRQLVAANKAADRGPSDPSVAGHLLRTLDAAGKLLPDEQLVCEFGVMFQGGHDTTARTMAWAL